MRPLTPPPGKGQQRAYAALAMLSLGLGGVGIVTPLLPTTPFVLVAAWAAARGHAGLHRWLYQHRRFGPLLRQWDAERAIPRRARLWAVAMIGASWLLLWWLLDNPVTTASAGVVMAAVALYVVTRPTPRGNHE